MAYLTKALTKDNCARIIFADTTSIVQKAHEIHSTSNTMTAVLGRSLTAASLIGALSKESCESVTFRLNVDGPAGGVVCVADSFGNVRGYVKNPKVQLPKKANGKIDVSGAVGKGTMYIIKDLGLSQPYVGTLPIVSGEIAEDVTEYFAKSEQTPTVCALGVRATPQGDCPGAGGFILQLMPEADENIISRIENNLKEFEALSYMIEKGINAKGVIDKVLSGIDYDIMQTHPIDFKCNCSRQRYARALMGLGKKELERFIEEKENVECECSFCGSKYSFDINQLQEMISTINDIKK